MTPVFNNDGNSDRIADNAWLKLQAVAENRSITCIFYMTYITF